MKKQIYFIPYAMADKDIYNNLIQQLNKYITSEVELIPIELKGHGKRRKEGLYKDIEEASKDIINQIQMNYDDNSQIYIYGHCMGGIIAYNIYQKVKNGKELNISKLILGSVGVNEKEREGFEGFLENYVKGTMEKTIKVVRKELFDEVLEYYTPLLRKEYNMVFNYYLNEKFVLDEKIVFINGKDDLSYDNESVKNNSINYDSATQYMVEGDHFFLLGECTEPAKIIWEEIKN